MGMNSLNSILNNEYRRLKGTNEYSIFNIKRNKKEYSEKEAQNKASYLASKFKNPGGMKFYLKVAWNLTDEYIDWLVKYSNGKTEPAKYFVSVANMKMLENK